MRTIATSPVSSSTSTSATMQACAKVRRRDISNRSRDRLRERQPKMPRPEIVLALTTVRPIRLALLNRSLRSALDVNVAATVGFEVGGVDL